MKRTLAILALIAVFAGCRKELPPPPEASELMVGVHTIALLLPEGWQHLDHGEEHIFRREFELIGVRDLGLRLPPEDGGSTVEEWIDLDMRRLGFTIQRDIASRRTVTLQGRDVFVIDTWDRLTHDHRRRFAFGMNEGHMLVIYSKQGRWEDIRPALEPMLDSLAFVDEESAVRETTQ